MGGASIAISARTANGTYFMIAGFWIEVLDSAPRGRCARTSHHAGARCRYLPRRFTQSAILVLGGPKSLLLQAPLEAVVTRSRQRPNMPEAFAAHPKD